MLFYQYYTGAIRTSRLPFADTWQAYDSTQDLVITSGPCNGTPMAYIQYKTWQLLYVDSSNNLRDMIRAGTNATWAPGLLANAAIQVSEATSTGLAASTSQWYSDNQVVNGFLVFYGGTDDLVHELTWHEVNNSWAEGHTFLGSNENAGFDTNLRGSTLSLILVNSLGCLEVWWRDFDPASNNTSVWTKGKLTIGVFVQTLIDKLSH